MSTCCSMRSWRAHTLLSDYKCSQRPLQPSHQQLPWLNETPALYDYFNLLCVVSWYIFCLVENLVSCALTSTVMWFFIFCFLSIVNSNTNIPHNDSTTTYLSMNHYMGSKIALKANVNLKRKIIPFNWPLVYTGTCWAPDHQESLGSYQTNLCSQVWFSIVLWWATGSLKKVKQQRNNFVISRKLARYPHAYYVQNNLKEWQ